MDIDKTAIDLLLIEGKLEPFIDAGLSVEDFEGDSKQIMAYVFSHYRNPRYHGSIPTKEILQRRFPDFKPAKPKEKLAWVIDQLRERADYNLISETMGKLGAALKKNNLAAARTMFQRANQELAARSAQTKTISLTRNMEERKLDYTQRRDKISLYGIPSTFKWITDWTLGYHEGDLIVILAKKGIGKTWFALLEAHTAQMEGETVMFCSREMAVKALEVRYDAIHAALPYRSFRRGELGHQLEKHYYKKLKEMKGLTPIHIPEFEGRFSAETIRAKARELKCRFVVVDGSYMLSDDQGIRSGWEKHFNIVNDLKQGLCKQDGCTVLVTNHLNREETQQDATLENAAFTDAYGQFADIALKLVRGADEKVEKEMRMEFLKIREDEMPDHSVRADWDFDRMLFRSKEEDRENADPEKVSY